MKRKVSKKQKDKATLVSVTEEMAQPRLTKSTRKMATVNKTKA
jgi:hypothetical protein